MLETPKKTISVDHIFTTAEDALRKLEERKHLRPEVEYFLGGDLPEYFRGNVFAYYARHIATPNHETLRMYNELTEKGIPVVIGQDSHDKFVSVNYMKAVLGRMPVLTGITFKDGKRIESFKKYTIIDFSKSEGRPIGDVKTLWGESLLGFHNRLFTILTGDTPSLYDDADWIDRHSRGDLVKSYKDQLALCISHAFLVEGYFTHDPHEAEFVKNILLPTIAFEKEMFGAEPLIVDLYPEERSDDYWFGYPPQVGEIIEAELQKVH